MSVLRSVSGNLLSFREHVASLVGALHNIQCCDQLPTVIQHSAFPKKKEVQFISMPCRRCLWVRVRIRVAHVCVCVCVSEWRMCVYQSNTCVCQSGTCLCVFRICIRVRHAVDVYTRVCVRVAHVWSEWHVCVCVC
jgi:hypothetical protein